MLKDNTLFGMTDKVAKFVILNKSVSGSSCEERNNPNAKIQHRNLILGATQKVSEKLLRRSHGGASAGALTMKKLYQDKEWLNNQYWNLEKPERQIATEQNRGWSVIAYWLKKLNIERRSKGEAYHLSQGNHVDLSSKAMEFIEGELLGDGHLEKRSKYSAYYTHGSKYKEYVVWLSVIFDGFGVKQGGNITQHINKIYKNIAYNYSSLYYSELLPLREKWYRLYNPETDGPNWKYEYIKIVPRDIELTPLVCRQWYIGDGCLEHNKGSINGKECIRLSTEGFPIRDVRFLIEKLNGLGFQSSRTKKNKIYISTKSVPAFLNYIGPCPVDCYKYKWEIKK